MTVTTADHTTTQTGRDLLDLLDARRGNTSIVGLQYGDEGKGQIVDALTGRFDYVVRYNGGANAGHSVHIGEQKFALHLIPSGILTPTVTNVVGNGVVICPEGILKEIDGLRERGVKVEDNLQLSDRAHIVMPWHKVEDKIRDAALAQAKGEDQKIGTTGRGIGPCYADKAHRGTAIRMCDLIDPPVLKEKIEYIAKVKNIVIKALADSIGEAFQPFDPAALYEQYNAFGQRLKPHVTDTALLLHDAMQSHRRILFEGANAALLDIDYGTFPFVTSSNTTSLGIYPGAGVPGGRVHEVFGVVKCYTSRVGGGPFVTELFDGVGERIREVGREFGTTTGRPRRTGWLDLVAVKYSTRLNGCTGIACTGLAVLSGIDTLKVCTGYRLNGKDLPGPPADTRLLAEVQPVYQELPGFRESISDCRAYADLPPQARAYIDLVGKVLDVPVKAVCVGQKRSQMLPVG